MSKRGAFIGVLASIGAIFICGIIALSLEAIKEPAKRDQYTIWFALIVCGAAFMFFALIIGCALFKEFQ